MDINIIRVELSLTVLDEDIDDIMVSALESGINYWCENIKVVGEYLGECAGEQISRGGTLILYDIDDNKEGYILTKDLFLNGLKMYLGNIETTDCLYMHNGKITIDLGFVDKNTADSIIQYALFGEIRFLATMI